jgi:hypothetical protein
VPRLRRCHLQLAGGACGASPHQHHQSLTNIQSFKVLICRLHACGTWFAAPPRFCRSYILVAFR